MGVEFLEAEAVSIEEGTESGVGETAELVACEKTDPCIKLGRRAEAGGGKKDRIPENLHIGKLLYFFLKDSSRPQFIPAMEQRRGFLRPEMCVPSRCGRSLRRLRTGQMRLPEYRIISCRILFKKGIYISCLIF